MIKYKKSEYMEYMSNFLYAIKDEYGKDLTKLEKDITVMGDGFPAQLNLWPIWEESLEEITSSLDTKDDFLFFLNELNMNKEISVLDIEFLFDHKKYEKKVVVFLENSKYQYKLVCIDIYKFELFSNSLDFTDNNTKILLEKNNNQYDIKVIQKNKIVTEVVANDLVYSKASTMTYSDAFERRKNN